jgi:type II secretory pathway component PulF
VTTPTTSSDPPLAAATAEALLDRVAQLGESSGDLVAGLRAAAEETESFRLAAALRHVAREVERGRPLDDVIAGTTRRLPPHLAGLVRAAQRTGKLGTVLAEWLDNRRAARSHWAAVIASLTYPAFTLVLALLIYILLSMAVVRPFKEIFTDIGIDIPFNLGALYWVSTTGLTWFLWTLGIVALALVGLRLIGGRWGWSWMMTQAPLIGGTWHWTGVSEMLRSLSLLVEHRLPLPEALRLAGDGASDAYVGSLCRELSQRVEQGSPLFLAILQQRGLPLSIVPLVRWGEQNDSLPDGLKSAAEMLEGRLRMRSLILIQILPPLVFILVGLMAMSFITAVMSTMFTMISGLS